MNSHLNCSQCDNLKKQIAGKESEGKDLKERLKDIEEQLHSFQNVIEPACEQIFSLSEQLEEEHKNRQDAEVLAKQVQMNNVKLKRQSQNLLQNLQKLDSFSLTKLADIDELVNDSIERKLTEIETERNLLKIKLEREKSEYKEKLQVMEKKNEELTSKLMELTNKNEEKINLINNFKRTSNLSIQEFTKLQDKMLEEVNKKETAEKYALDCSLREKSLRHQSALLVESNSSDEKIMNLLLQIEELTKELIQERESHKRELSEIREDLRTSQDVEISHSEVERLHRSIIELERWKEAATLEMDTLKQKCEDVSIPLQPPPPCPPPPPFISKSVNKIKKSVSSGTSITTSRNSEASNQDKLLSDLKKMMTKIKVGDKNQNQTVKLPRKEKELPPALMELQSVLARMKTKDAVQKSPFRTALCPKTLPSAPIIPTHKPKVYRTLSKESQSVLNQEESNAS